MLYSIMQWMKKKARGLWSAHWGFFWNDKLWIAPRKKGNCLKPLWSTCRPELGCWVFTCKKKPEKAEVSYIQGIFLFRRGTFFQFVSTAVDNYITLTLSQLKTFSCCLWEGNHLQDRVKYAFPYTQEEAYMNSYLHFDCDGDWSHIANEIQVTILF